MAQRSLEERVDSLEHQVAELRAALSDGNRPKDWRRTIGMFTGDAVMKRIDKEARKYREADRRIARQRTGRSRGRKS
jgi:hypothetical protein